MMADEAKSQLQIHGSFGNTPGTVTIEDTTLGIVSWSDSLIVCDLPDSGKGSGGGVIVHMPMSESKKRMLSIFTITIIKPFWAYWKDDPHMVYWYITCLRKWKVRWRADIYESSQKQFAFESSKSSQATCNDVDVTWHDTSVFFDEGFSFGGIVDNQKSKVLFYKEKFKHNNCVDSDYSPPSSINFDTKGLINGFAYYSPGDMNGLIPPSADTLTGEILFPPNPKSTVYQQFQIRDPIKIRTEDRSVKIESESPLGTSTASLYSVDGRLLKRTKLDVSSPGVFTIDASDLHVHFAILVLQTDRGIIRKKILL